MPETEAPGCIAIDSVRVIPVAPSTSRSDQIACFSVWSGLAG